MIRLSTLAVLAASLSFSFAEDAPPEPAGMKTIFNGEDLEGWSGDTRLWSVVDGAIRGETTKDKVAKGNTFLIWEGGDLADFELRLSFRVGSVNNSWIQYRSKHIKGSNDWVVRGYQHEIRNSGTLPNVAGFIYDEKSKRGRIILVGQKGEWKDGKLQVEDEVIDAEGFEALFKVDGWNDVVIVADGNRIKHYMNGKLILDFTDSDPERALSEGVLALQLHGGKPMWVEFKDVRVKKK